MKVYEMNSMRYKNISQVFLRKVFVGYGCTSIYHKAGKQATIKYYIT